MIYAVKIRFWAPKRIPKTAQDVLSLHRGHGICGEAEVGKASLTRSFPLAFCPNGPQDGCGLDSTLTWTLFLSSCRLLLGYRKQCSQLVVLVKRLRGSGTPGPASMSRERFTQMGRETWPAPLSKTFSRPRQLLALGSCPTPTHFINCPLRPGTSSWLCAPLHL